MVFTIPPVSARLLSGVPFDHTTPFANQAKQRFDALDTPENQDKNNCKALLKFTASPVQAVF